MLRYLSFIVFALSLLLVGCEKESIDIIEEVPETLDPVIIETEEEQDVFSLRMPSGDTIPLTSRGIINESGLVAITTSDFTEISCIDGEGLLLSVQGDSPGFWLVFLSEPTPEPFLAGGVDIAGFSEGYSFLSPSCASTTPELNITSLTENRVVGSFTAEFFTPVPDTDGTRCEDLISTGPVTVDFDVKLDFCS